MTNASGTWTKCGPHEISRLAGRLRARRQRRIVGGRVLALALAGAMVALWFYPRPDQGPDFAGISCKRVGQLADAYVKKQLPPELQDQVGRHIALCPICREMFENMPTASRLLPGDHHAPAVDAPRETARFASR